MSEDENSNVTLGPSNASSSLSLSPSSCMAMAWVSLIGFYYTTLRKMTNAFNNKIIDDNFYVIFFSENHRLLHHLLRLFGRILWSLVVRILYNT
jgi:hypothetical protein